MNGRLCPLVIEAKGVIQPRSGGGVLHSLLTSSAAVNMKYTQVK